MPVLKTVRCGSSFELPESIDANKIEQRSRKIVLTVTRLKKSEAQKPAKKIEVKAAEREQLEPSSDSKPRHLSLRCFFGPR